MFKTIYQDKLFVPNKTVLGLILCKREDEVYWLEAVNCCIKGETIKGDLTQEFYDQAQ
jgi:hypothetical protein